MPDWKPVPTYEGCYEVSDLGEVRSVPRRVRNGTGTRRVSGRVLRQYRRPDGRLSVNLSKDDAQATVLVHRLVLEAFTGIAPDDSECCHTDGNPTNNRLTNLRWDTHLSNIADVARHGTNFSAHKTVCPRGHLLKQPNLKPAQFQKGGRSCLVCSREYALARAQQRPFDPSRADERYHTLGF